MEGTAVKTWRIAVLTSGHGRGSNLRAMHNWFRDHKAPLEISFATVARQSAPVAELCLELGIPCEVLNPKHKERFESELLNLCIRYKIHLIALAGFMSLLSAEFLDQSGIPVLNIHPALLPEFGGKGMYGMKVHEAVFASGSKVSGASVHLVDPLYDHGVIVSQCAVDISDCQSPEEIAARVLTIEHKLYAPAILGFLDGIRS